MNAFIGGHPQLIRLALYSIAQGQVSLEDAVQNATEAGLYGNHLQRLRSSVERDSSLKTAFRKVLASEEGCAIDAGMSAALRSLGVGKLRGNQVEVTCELYRQYFRSVWS